jgi:hypothetical protein
MRCWRGMKNISWTDGLRNEKALYRFEESTIEIRQIICIGHIMLRNCLFINVIEGKVEGRIEVTGRGGRRRKKLLDDLKKKTGYLN